MERALGCQKSSSSYSDADMERLAQHLSGLKALNDGGTAEALLWLASRQLGFEKVASILVGTAAGLHFDLMWRAHLASQLSRERNGWQGV